MQLKEERLVGDEKNNSYIILTSNEKNISLYTEKRNERKRLYSNQMQ